MKDRKKLEEELRIYKDRLEGAMEAGDLAWWEMELPSGETRFNSKKAEMLGYSSDNFDHYTGFTDLLHPEDHDRAMKAMRDHLEGREPRYEVEYRIKKKGGDYKWFRDVGGITEEDGDGNPKKVTGVVIDIDERKRAEEELARSREELKNLIDGMNDTVWVIDFDGDFLEVNQRAVEVLGYSREELLSMKPHDIDAGLEPGEITELIDTMEEDEVQVFETVHETKDGEKIPVEISSSLVPYEGETVILSVARDISRRKEVEEREEFLHSLLRHDVRNKAQITQGYLELLKDFDLPDEAQEQLERAEKAVQESTKIIEKVRMLREAEEEEVKSVKIDSIVESVVEENQVIAREQGMEIETKCPSFGCRVRGGSLLKELFTNLIGNSIRHSGGDRIIISGRESEDEIICSVEDDGKGIPNEEKEKIFDRGYTTDEERGTGLGMFLVKILLDIYDGSIEVKDSELGGARFDVHLKKA